MKGRDKGGKENWLLIKADDEYAVASDSTALLEAKPRSIKTGRTVEDVAKSKVKIKPKRGRKTDGGPRAKAPRPSRTVNARGPVPRRRRRR